MDQEKIVKKLSKSRLWIKIKKKWTKIEFKKCIKSKTMDREKKSPEIR